MIVRVNIHDGIDIRNLVSYLKVMQDFAISKEDQEALSSTVDVMESLLRADTRTDTNIYYDQQHKWDVEYIRDDLTEYIDDDDMVSRLRGDPDFCDRVAYRYRKYLYDCITADDEMDCLQWAYKNCSEY